MAPRLIIKVPVVMLMGYATYLAIKCPCKKMMSCHYEPFVISIVLANTLMLIDCVT